MAQLPEYQLTNSVTPATGTNQTVTSKPTAQASKSITNLSNSPTKLAKKGNSIYDLVEFEADGLITGEINPEAKDYSKYTEFEKNSLGATVIDKNKDISSNKTIINLYTSKPSNEKFNQIVDIEFSEFVSPVDSPLTFLESRLASLESSNAKTSSEKAALNREITQLRSQIASLRDQLALAVDPGRDNIVSDTLMYGAELRSDRNGSNGNIVQNILLSRNRTAKAVMFTDGNLYVLSGTYDYNGNLLGPDRVVWKRGGDGITDGIKRFSILKLSDKLETIRADFSKTEAQGIFRQIWSAGVNTTSNARLQLTDSGILNLYDGPNVIWSSYGS